jgi:hypothetical protein
VAGYGTYITKDISISISDFCAVNRQGVIDVAFINRIEAMKGITLVVIM